MANIRYGGISLDCADPRELAGFWADLLGGEVAFESDDFVAVKFDAGWLTAVRVPDHRAPTWPGGPTPKQVHIELKVTDLESAHREAVAKGARDAETQPRPESWRVLLDPAGHPFCITTLIPD